MTTTAFIPPRTSRFGLPLPFVTPFDDPTVGHAAYHEAAHAVVGLCLGQNPRSITVVPNGESNGRTITCDFGSILFAESAGCPAEVAVGAAWGGLCTVLAGPVADYLWFEDEHPGCLFGCGYSRHEDLYKATRIATRIMRPKHAEPFYEEAAWQTHQFLNRRDARRAVASLARRLRRAPTLDEAAIRRVPWVESARLLRTHNIVETWAPRVRNAGKRPKLERLVPATGDLQDGR